MALNNKQREDGSNTATINLSEHLWKSSTMFGSCQNMFSTVSFFSRIWYSRTCQIKNHTQLTYMYKKLEVKYNLLCNHLNPDTWIHVYDTCTIYIVP